MSGKGPVVMALVAVVQQVLKLLEDQLGPS